MRPPDFPPQAVVDRVRALYGNTAFAQAAAVWATALADHLSQLNHRDAKVLNWTDPQHNTQRAVDLLAAGARDPSAVDEWIPAFRERLQVMLANGQNLHHPRYLGHQVPACLPIAALFDAVGSVTNQVMAIYEMGPWATAVERAMVEQLGAEIGYRPGSFGGLVTSGGSLANLTALLTARNVRLRDVWSTGVQHTQQLALVVQADVHYCIARAAGILGIGTNQVVKVPVDDRRRMRVDQLQRIVTQLKQQGRQIVAVVAGACSTPIGAFDPLEEIADVCDREGIWMHVDAAHGGAVLLSDRYRHLVQGIQRADSIVWDAHKMLFMPALCAFAFYKDAAHRFAAFEQDAPYLFDPSNPGIADYDSGVQTVECTKRAAAFGVWGIWSLFGRQLFGDLVEVTFALAQSMHRQLMAASDFQPLHQPQCNIQVFRYTPAATEHWPTDRQGELQLEIRRRLIQSGQAYIVPIKLDGVGALRATLINPLTTEQDVADVLDAIRSVGSEILAGDGSPHV